MKEVAPLPAKRLLIMVLVTIASASIVTGVVLGVVMGVSLIMDSRGSDARAAILIVDEKLAERALPGDQPTATPDQDQRDSAQSGPSPSGMDSQALEIAAAQGGFDLSNLQIDREALRPGGPPRDGIPAITDPTRTPVSEISSDDFVLTPDSRIIAVESGGDVVGYPIPILHYHEIINDEVDETPVAVTYCPLCDSAAVFDRRLEYEEDGERKTRVLEFGVSGLLFNSNVVMYDRTDEALWSQVMMQAISGPQAGRELDTLPVRVMSWRTFGEAYPDAAVVHPRDTGHRRPYAQMPYEGYFRSDGLMFPVQHLDETRARKIPGLAVRDGDRVLFIPQDAVTSAMTIGLASGTLELEPSEAGMRIVSKPEGVQALQTFYYAWFAAHPETEYFQPDIP